METASKGDFAKLIGVSAGRISQMIAEGKISGDALEGEGRNARIVIDKARAQIRQRTDIGQSLGNGIATRVSDTPSRVTPSPTGPSTPATPTIDDELRRERLTQIRFQNRRAAAEERESQGMYTRTDQVRNEMTKLAGQMLATFDGAMVDLANAVSAKFNLPQRDVLHLLRQEGRTIKTKAAEAALRKSVELPVSFEDTFADASDEAAGQA